MAENFLREFRCKLHQQAQRIANRPVFIHFSALWMGRNLDKFHALPGSTHQNLEEESNHALYKTCQPRACRISQEEAPGVVLEMAPPGTKRRKTRDLAHSSHSAQDWPLVITHLLGCFFQNDRLTSWGERRQAHLHHFPVMCPARAVCIAHLSRQSRETNESKTLGRCDRVLFTHSYFIFRGEIEIFYLRAQPSPPQPNE